MKLSSIFFALGAFPVVGLAQETPVKSETPQAASQPARPAFALEPKELDALGAYADLLIGAGLDDESVGALLLDEARSALASRMRARAPEGGSEPPPPEGERPGRRFRAMREPLAPFVKAKIGEGLKGADLAAAIEAEQDRRREAAGGPGAGRRGPEGGGAPGGAASRPSGGEERPPGRFGDRARESAGGVVKKLRAQGLKGRALAEAFVKEFGSRIEGMRGGRPRPGSESGEGSGAEKPREGPGI